ncbi:MAG: thiolase family protein [Gemmataceae bacterium]
MSEAVLLSAVRTPIGKYLGGLSQLTAPQLGAAVVAEAVKRAQAKPDQVDEVIIGNVLQAGVGQNPARQVALRAGFSDTIAAYTVNKVCGSGLKAVMLAVQAIKAGDGELIVSGGIESMSQAPYLLFGAREGWKYGDQKVVDAMVHDGLWCAFENRHMGEFAEHIANKFGITREDQDRFSAQSHQRAVSAWEKGAFTSEVLPLSVGTGSRSTTMARDEGLRPDTTTEALSKLKPAFQSHGSVTAGNASMLSDGAAAVVVSTIPSAEKLGVKPLARIVEYATTGVKPEDVFIAPVSAIRYVLEKANLRRDDIDLFELNEAFAAQMLACNAELQIDESKINVNGGAIALGHPIGASGTRVLVTLAHALRERDLKRGVASLCLGGGNAVAMVIERM